MVLIWIGIACVCGGLPGWVGAQPAPTEPLLLTQEAAKRARVIMVENTQATVAFDPQSAPIEAMVSRGLLALTGKKTSAEAWLSLVSTQEIVGVKVFAAPGAISGTRLPVVSAVVQGLLNAGFTPSHIVIWDKRLIDLRRAGYSKLADRYGVRIAGAEDEGYDDSQFYDTALLGHLVWGDHEFGRKGDSVGRKSFVSKLVTRQMTKIINLMPLLNHNVAGVTGNLYGLATGSVDNTLRFEESNRLASAVPEIYALPVIGDRVVLNIVDALTCQYEGEHTSLLHYSTPLNQLWFSTDPVALDVLSIHEMEQQRKAAHISPLKTNLELYQNASLLEIGLSDDRLIQVERVP
jgi:hypothetical protein